MERPMTVPKQTNGKRLIIQNSGNNCRPCILRLGTVFGKSFRPRYDLVVNLFSGLIAKNKKIGRLLYDYFFCFNHRSEGLQDDEETTCGLQRHSKIYRIQYI